MKITKAKSPQENIKLKKLTKSLATLTLVERLSNQTKTPSLTIKFSKVTPFNPITPHSTFIKFLRLKKWHTRENYHKGKSNNILHATEKIQKILKMSLR